MPDSDSNSLQRYFSCITIVAVLIFLFWLVTVFMPIATVEMKYQYYRLLSDVFHTTDIRGIILPQFKIDLTGYTSKYTKNGVTIPAIHLDEPIIYNVDPNDETAYKEALRHGIAHASGTAIPGSGGVGYYFAHSSSPDLTRQFNAVFYLLGKLKEGDDIYIWHDGNRGDYKIVRKAETDPEDVSFLNSTGDGETIVLQTCWPPGSTSRRLLIFAQFKPKN